MPQPITVLMMGICFAMLYLRYKNRPQNAAPRTRKQQIKTAKILFAALIAWLAIHYSLQHTLAKMDGADTDPSMMERLVSFLSK